MKLVPEEIPKQPAFSANQMYNMELTHSTYIIFSVLNGPYPQKKRDPGNRRME